MKHVVSSARSHLARAAAIAFLLACGGGAVAQTNAPATNAPPASSGGAARQGGAPAAPAAPPAAAAPATAAPAAPAGTVDACPTLARGTDHPIDCVCTAAAAAADEPVWGTDVYTDDSSICRAARHAGVIGPGGGTVRMTPRPGLQSYPASERNGVSSQTWGAYERAFTVALSATRGSIDVNQCPTTFESYSTSSGVISCMCTAAQAAEGSVWGTDVYTSDSSICRAGVHAGIIPPSGGSVRMRIVPGRQSYAGSTRNGVQSQDWGQWDAAFGFDK